MKKIKWNVLAFVSWVLITLIVINVCFEAVNQKNKAIQEAQRALNEVSVKKAEAEKMLVQAKAEREANELKTASLTPAILQKMWIEKWDGKLPVYGNVPQMMMVK